MYMPIQPPAICLLCDKRAMHFMGNVRMILKVVRIVHPEFLQAADAAV
jgi:hypothetical protein